MLYEKHHEFSDAQAITADAVSTNVIYLPSLSGIHGNWFIHAKVGTALASAANGTSLQVYVQDCATEDGSYVTRLIGAEIEEADLTAGAYALKVAIPPGLADYVQLYYQVGSEEDFTSGTIDAFLAPGVDAPVPE